MSSQTAERTVRPVAPPREPPSPYRRAEAALWRRYGIAPSERFVDVDDLGLGVRVQEAGEGEPLLFVHGGPNGGSTFIPLAAEMPERRCLLLDRPGCGLSGPVEYGRIPLPRLAATTLVGVLDRLGIERIDVAGSSFGGAWALWFAAAHPERVRRLVLLGAPALVPGMLVPGFMRMMCTPGIGQLMPMLPQSVSGAKWVHRQMGHAASALDALPAEYWEWGLRLMSDTATMASDGRVIRTVATPFGVRRGIAFTPDQLGAVAAPSLLYWGAADTFGGGDVARAVAGLLPHAALELVPHAGHLPWLDDPAHAAQCIRAFLDA
ncbi:MAG TPA: alpha/beta hydrolase [Longimicrobium sp.]|jgi:pimeloyl-ACP methyl ester carboxylesterase|uniref:alpha/beta fold hydrolase n=1 Tax=Longimicrobium sp. TaxID=2029185 RepID=UPI002EDAE76E